MKKHWFSPLVVSSLLSVSMLMSGCQSSPTKEPSIKGSSAIAATPEELYSQALKQQGVKKSEQLLIAAEAFLRANNPQRALAIVQTVPAEPLSDALYVKHTHIQSHALIKTQNIYEAKGLLESDRVHALLRMPSPPTSLLPIRAHRAELYYDLGEWEMSITERIELAEVLEQTSGYTDRAQSTVLSRPSASILNGGIQPISAQSSSVSSLDEHPDQQINQELIWMTLMELDLEQLEQARQKNQQNGKTTEEGWYTLAVVSKDNQRNISQQYSALQIWQAEWSTHPANRPLPADLALIADIVNNQPNNVAVLLPTSGKLGKAGSAIRDGFMAAYYTNQAAGGTVPDVAFYDVSEGDINAHYDLAISEGAEVVIGPLSKKDIDQLALRPQLPVITLGLNNIAEGVHAPKQLFQLGLGIEDEAIQAAERAHKDGKETALIMVPSSQQGERAAQAFTRHWQSLGGSIAGVTRYSSDPELSGLIENAMRINDSKRRAKQLQSHIGGFKFEPRPRKDVDMIFLMAKPRQGRQIKPLFAFHYAGRIPIYSTSRIYEGNSAGNDSDLNGIQFSHLPWFFQDSPEKSLVTANRPLSASMQRLYALGVDTYYLYPRLMQLQESKNARFWGQIGILSLNGQRQFLRKQQWAMFKKGRPHLFHSPADAPPEE